MATKQELDEARAACEAAQRVVLLEGHTQAREQAVIDAIDEYMDMLLMPECRQSGGMAKAHRRKSRRNNVPGLQHS